MSITTKLGMLMTYLERLLPIKSDDSLVSWFCKITWQVKNISATFYKNIDGRQTWQGGDSPWGTPTKSVTWSYKLEVNTHNKLQLLNLSYHNTCGHQISQGGDIPLYRDIPIKSFDPLVIDLVRSRDRWNTYISRISAYICRRPMREKVGKVVICCERR